MKRAIFFCILILFGCASEKADTTPTHKNFKGIIIKSVEYDDGEVQGTVLNKSANSYKEVVLKLDFYTRYGKKVLSRKFKIVPGMDKKIFKPNFTKHFQYKIRLKPQRPYLKVIGEIISAN